MDGVVNDERKRRGFDKMDPFFYTAETVESGIE